jgi:hypothetical protein
MLTALPFRIGLGRESISPRPAQSYWVMRGHMRSPPGLEPLLPGETIRRSRRRQAV